MYDKSKKEIVRKNKRDIFMVPNLYRDDSKAGEDPVQIERDLAAFEGEVAVLINKRLLVSDSFDLTIDECERLKFFFAVMAFRSSNSKNIFESFEGQNKDFYSHFQFDGDMGSFWKRNLAALAKCRTYAEASTNDSVDWPIQLFMRRDTQGLFGMYPVVLERRGGEDFIIGDIYPVQLYGILDGGLQVQLFAIYPLSPKRVLLMVSYGAERAPLDIRMLDSELLARPHLSMDGKTIHLTVKKIYEPKVREINDLIFEHAQIGVAMLDPERVRIEH